MATGSLKLQAGLSDLQLAGGGWGRRVKWAVPELRALFVLRMLRHSAKDLLLKRKTNTTKKQPCFEGHAVLQENLPLGHLDFSTQNEFVHGGVHACLWAMGLLPQTSLCHRGAA